MCKGARGVFGLAEWLTVHWRCAQGAWSGWRWRDRHNLEPTWRTWTPPHTRRDLEKMERRGLCGAQRRRLTGRMIWICLKRLTCKFDMELIFRFEYLNIKGAVWGKVLHRPGSQDRLMVLMETVGVLHLYPWRETMIRVCFCLTAAMRSTSLRLLKMKQASALSILQDRPFRIRENTSNKVKMYIVRRSALSGKEQPSFIYMERPAFMLCAVRALVWNC